MPKTPDMQRLIEVAEVERMRADLILYGPRRIRESAPTLSDRAVIVTAWTHGLHTP